MHARLPTCFGSRVARLYSSVGGSYEGRGDEKAPGPMEKGVSNIGELAGALRGKVKEGVKQTVVDGVVNDRWITKIVGKVAKKLEEARGDVGYSGDIPVELRIYRSTGWEKEGKKLLP